MVGIVPRSHTMRWKWWLWALFIVVVYWLGTLFGSLYAWFAIPIYSQVCQRNALAFLDSAQPLSSENYQMFLLGKGCSLQEVRDKEKKELEELERACGSRPDPMCASLRTITPNYRPAHSWSNDDLIGNFLSNLFALYTDHFWSNFIPSALEAADWLAALVNENVLFRAVYSMLYAGVVAFLGYLLSNVAKDVYTAFKSWLGPL
jgi:hypothetical protein